MRQAPAAGHTNAQTTTFSAYYINSIDFKSNQLFNLLYRFRREASSNFDSWQIEGLDAHNKYRSWHGAPPLELDRNVGIWQ
jgi:hypothetical protein